MTEHDEQAALFDLLSYHHKLGAIFAIPNGGLRNVVVAMQLKREGVRAGVWDIFVPFARGGYHGFFIEMKFGKNRLTPAQVLFGEAMREEGYRCEVAYTAEEAYDAIIDYLVVRAVPDCGIINMPAMFSHPGNDQTVLEA